MDISDGRADGLRAVAQDLDLDRLRNGCLEPRQSGLDAIDGVDDVGTGNLEDGQQDRAFAVRPRGQFHVFRPVHRAPDVAHAHWRTVLVGYDDIVPRGCLQQLIVVIDRVGAPRALDRAFRIVDRGHRDFGADILEHALVQAPSDASPSESDLVVDRAPPSSRGR